jgi:hypothetical protein
MRKTLTLFIALIYAALTLGGCAPRVDVRACAQRAQLQRMTLIARQAAAEYTRAASTIPPRQ